MGCGMKIRDAGESKPVLRVDKSARSSKAKESAKASSVASDTVSLSADVEQLKALGSSDDNVSEIRSAKVDELKERINNGQYYVPAGDIANALVEHVLKHRMRE